MIQGTIRYRKVRYERGIVVFVKGSWCKHEEGGSLSFNPYNRSSAMRQNFVICLLLLAQDGRINVDAFCISSVRFRSYTRTFLVEGEEGATNLDKYDLLPPNDVDVGNKDNHADNHNQVEETTRTELKRQLYQLAASYDRGFGATPKAQKDAGDIIEKLGALNPTHDSARGIDGNEDNAPLKAIWRMIWTSAFDVVSLGASPFAGEQCSLLFTTLDIDEIQFNLLACCIPKFYQIYPAPSAMYKDITKPPLATNIIDFIPRAQTLINFSSLSSLLRAEVTTRASTRCGFPNRVGLVFERVKLQPIELLGQKLTDLPPLTVDFTLPGSLLEQLASLVPGLDNYLGLSDTSKEANDDSPGYFDVKYLDNELLIIRQQAPGGLFALVKVDNCDP